MLMNSIELVVTSETFHLLNDLLVYLFRQCEFE